MPNTTHQLKKWLIPTATTLLLATAPHIALAEKHKHDDHDHEMEQHSSHEHGAARLTIATTDDGMEVSLESPAANVFGFEHDAKTETELEVVHAALAKLKDGAALFMANASAECSLERVEIESAVADSHDDHDHEKEAKHDDHDHEKEEKHDEHAHDKEEKHDDHAHDKEEKHDDHAHDKEEKHDEHDHNKEEKHDEHDHDKEEKHDDQDHDKHTEGEESHSDVEATWAYHCEKPAALETVSVKLFSAFPNGFEELAVEWITASNAGKAELSEDGSVNLK